MTIPAGFVPFPEATTRLQVDCWTEPGSSSGVLVFCVHRLHRELKRDPIQQLDLPAGNSYKGFKWKGFDLEGMRIVKVQQGERVFVLTAQVPLRREAVELTIAGAASEEARAKALMVSTLATFEGNTNWLSESDRATRLRVAAAWWIGIALALVIVLVWRKRRAAT